MYVPLRRFSSVEELKPVFDHGGEVIFLPLAHGGTCYANGILPWRIHIRSWAPRNLGLSDQMKTLVHEVVHLFHSSGTGYYFDLGETDFFHEKQVIQQTKRLMTRHPNIADDIVRALIVSPHCTVTFTPESETFLYNPFRKYYFDLVAELAKQQLP
jgi:hypothetical protein